MTTVTVHLPDRVAANVRQLMGREQITQRTICRWLGLTQGTVSKKCSGTQPFTVAELEVLADRFGVQAHQFLMPVMDDLPPLGTVTREYGDDWPVIVQCDYDLAA